jgi:hypothetical protein
MPPDREVVVYHNVTVTCGVHIKLDRIRTRIQRKSECRARVFGHIGVQAAVCHRL